MLRVTTLSCERDEAARTQVTVLRYGKHGPDGSQFADRDWLLHWHSQDGFASLAAAAGLRVAAVELSDGSPAPADATDVQFQLIPV